MSEPFYTARVSVSKVDGLHRRAVLEDGTRCEFGVHGAVKAHYGCCSCRLTTRDAQRRTGGARDQSAE